MTTGEQRLTLLTRRRCPACDEARATVQRLAAELGVGWTERDATRDAEDWAEYGERLPVLLLDGREHSYWTIDESRLRADLRR
jgi:glutaredoxin